MSRCLRGGGGDGVDAGDETRAAQTPRARARAQRDARRRVRPGRLARNFVRRPKRTCALVALVPVLALGVVVAAKVFELKDPGFRDYLIFGSERVRVDDARGAARDETEIRDVKTFLEGAEGQREGEVVRGNRKDVLTIWAIWRQGGEGGVEDVVDRAEEAGDGENFLTRENVAMMKRLEDQFVASEGYGRFCWKDEEARDCDGKVPNCAPPKSITSHPLLYGVVDSNNVVCGRRKGSDVVSKEQFDRFLAAIVTPAAEGNGVRAIVSDIRPFLGVEANETQVPRTFVARGSFEFGLPFEGFVSEDEDKDEQRSQYTTWIKNLVPTLEESARTAEKPLNMILNGQTYSNSIFGEQATKDLSFAIAAIVAVMAFMWLHTGSLFLAATSMFQVVLAFPLSYFFYRVVFRIAYFSSLQIMTIFLILGIAADDAFVFVDAWKQSAVVLGSACDLERRMSWTFRRAVKAMAVTSFTTALAFAFTAVSPVMPVGTLGYWAATLVLLQYVLIIFMYPCAVIMWHRSLRTRKISNCFKAPEETPTLITPEDDERSTKDEANGVGIDENAGSSEENTETAVSSADRDGSELPQESLFKRLFGSGTKDEDEYRIVERFFRYKWSKWILKARFPLVIFALLFFGASVYFATQLEPLTEEESFLPDTHPLLLSLTLLKDAFPSADGTYDVIVSIFWGVSGIDRSEVSRYDPDEMGEAVFDKSFDLRPAASQQHLLDACDTVKRNRDLLPAFIAEEADCWINDFRVWRSLVKNSTAFESYSSNAALANDLKDFFSFKNETSGRTPFLRHLRNGRVAFSPDGDRDRVVFTELRFRTAVKREEPASVIWPFYEDWQEQTDKLAESAPESVNRPLVTGGYPFMWAVTTTTLIHNAFVGLGIMLGVALIVLAISTANIIVAGIALLAIGGIVTNLLALINLWNYEMGLTESVSVIIAAGVSFDFASHLANAYTESEARTRFPRVRDALTDLGISVLAGGLSTMISAAMLFFATITFFQKFARFVVSTIALSLFWSLALMMAMLLVFGPEGELGSLKPLFRRAAACLPSSCRPSTGQEKSNVESVEDVHDESSAESSAA